MPKNPIQYEWYSVSILPEWWKLFFWAACIIVNAGDVIINVGGIDIKGKPYGAVKEKTLC